MADDGDRAMELAERERMAVARRRVEPDAMPGPQRCVNCGWPNDNAKAGLARCSDCIDPVGCVECE